jgi:type IX secretion system PorP/SprF family membrane protein
MPDLKLIILKKNSAISSQSFVKVFSILIILLNIVGSSGIRAQDPSNFTHFFLNPYLLNSSYAGFDGQPSVSFVYRKQWMTIEGAPTIANLSLQVPVNARISAGVNVTNDSKGFFNNSVLLFSMAYHVPIQDHIFLRFGISAGGSWNTVDMKKLEAINDPALANVLQKNASLAGNAGISLHYHLFNFGVALPTLFSPSYVSEDAFNVKEVKPFEALILHASNRFYFNSNKNIFEPYAVYRINTALPSQFELAGIVHLNHLVWAGASYKQDFGISVLGGVKMKNMLAIGGSYSLQKSGADELNSPSFEVSVNYLFGPHRKGAPVYSFVNAVKVKEKAQTGAARQAIATRTQQAEAEQKRKADAEKLKQEQLEEKKRLAAAQTQKQQSAQRTQAETQAKLKREADEKKRLDAEAELKREQAEKQKASESAEETRTLAEQNRLEQQEKARLDAERAKQEREALARKNAEEQARAEQEASARRKLAEEERLRREEARQRQLSEEVLATQQAPPPTDPVPVEGAVQHEEEQLQRLAAHAGNPNQAVEDTARIAGDVRHEFVKHGNHAQELPVSDYVIVGVFKSDDNAKRFSDGLRSLNFKTQFGHLTEKQLWYVYLFKTTNINQARAEQTRVSKLFLLRDAWLLTVEP